MEMNRIRIESVDLMRVCVREREKERGCGEGIRGLLVNEVGVSTVGLNGGIRFEPLDV